MKNHRLFLCAVTALTVFNVFNPAPAIVYQQWDYRIAGPNHGVFPSCGLGVDSLGNSYLSGAFARGSSPHEYYFMKFDPAGQLLWTSLIDNAGSVWDYPSAMATDPQGNSYLAGNMYSPGNNNYLTVKIDTWGEAQWQAIYNGPANSFDFAAAIALDHLGNVYVTGSSDQGNSDNDYATIKYNAQGIQQWVARYNGPVNDNDAATGIAVNGEGNVYVTGQSRFNTTVPSNYNYATIKYNSQGVQQWIAIYDGPDINWDIPKAIVVDDQANVYVTGNSARGMDYDIATVKYNSSGVQQWVARFDSLNDYEWARDLKTDLNGNVIVIAESNDFGGLLLKYNANGELLWMRINQAGGFYEGTVAVSTRGLWM